MRFLSSVTILLAGSSVASSLSIQTPNHGISGQEADAEEAVDASLAERFDESLASQWEKRRGGGGSSGGGGGGGGGGGRSSSGGSTSSGSSGSSGGSTAGSSSGSRGSGNTGTASSSSSVAPSYGGGRYYGGGSTSAYRAGSSSPRGIAPYVIGGAALGLLPGLWLGAAYAYPYSHPYNYHNASKTSQPAGTNESLPVTCLCQQYNACGCDNNDNSTYLDSVLGNGSAASLNSSLVNIADVNGTKTIILNGTLPNGTDDSTSDTSPTDSSSSGVQILLEASGFWVMIALVAATVWMT